MASSKSYSETPLFESNGKKITCKEFSDALVNVGIKKNDTVFVHSDITSFGKLALFDRNRLCEILFKSIQDTISSGTIIMPTFSYSFESKEPFDLSSSKSKVGVLSEFFRTMPNVKRTAHPTHSVAISGNDEQLLQIGKDTFGENSIFGKLHKKKGKILFFGAPFQSCTFIHHIEQTHSVPYRKNKKITGTIIEGKRQYQDTFDFYAKYFFFFTYLEKLENHLLDTKKMKAARVGDGMIYVVDSTDLFDEGMKLLDKNIFFFVKDKPWPFFIFNHFIFRIINLIPGFASILDNIAKRFIK